MHSLQMIEVERVVWILIRLDTLQWLTGKQIEIDREIIRLSNIRLKSVVVCAFSQTDRYQYWHEWNIFS